MPASTPIASSKSAALSRLLDSIPKCYSRYTSGTIKADKVPGLAQKFHERFGIGCTPAQRITRKKHGQASCLLIVFCPPDAAQAQWLMLATDGTGLEMETMRRVTDKPRLQWLGYELVRHPHKDTTRWTVRRSSAEMAEHYALLAELQSKHHTGAVGELLQRLANQPGFNGVRTQTWELFQVARQWGYEGELPHLFFQQKITHGERLLLG